MACSCPNEANGWLDNVQNLAWEICVATKLRQKSVVRGGWDWECVRTRILDRGKASCATCGNQQTSTDCGFMVAIWPNHDIILDLSHCNWRHGTLDYRPRFMACPTQRQCRKPTRNTNDEAEWDIQLLDTYLRAQQGHGTCLCVGIYSRLR